MKKYINIITLAPLALLAATSCQKELTDGNEGSRINSDEIGFSINQSNYWNNNASGPQTKAGDDLTLYSEDGDSICLSLTISDNIGIGSGPDSMTETKGTPYSADNFATKIDGIGVIGYLDGTSSAYVSYSANFAAGEILSKTSTTHPDDKYKTHWAPAHTYYWPKASSLDFWAWAPQAEFEAAAGSSGNVKITDFTINNSTSPKSLTFDYDLLTSDATEQPDLMFASKFGATQSTVNAGAAGCVPLDMKHALAAVRFVVKSKKGGTVSYISLVDVSKTGSCSYDGAAFTWTETTAAAATYTHNFNTKLTADQASDFYSATGGQEAATFMMIPQTLGTQKISIKLAKDPNSAPAEYTGSIPTTSVTKWEAGKTYVYTINIDEDVNVNITDQVSTSNVKSNVVVTNTGSTRAYLRAVIVGNWTDGRGKVINTPWTPTQDTWTVNGATATAPGGESIAVQAIQAQCDDSHFQDSARYEPSLRSFNTKPMRLIRGLCCISILYQKTIS